MRNYLLLWALALLCVGCATGLEDNGKTEIMVGATKMQDTFGNTTYDGWNLDVKSGKEYSDINATFEKKGDNFRLAVGAKGVEAFRGQEIAGDVKKEQLRVISEVAGKAAEKAVGALVPGSGVATKIPLDNILPKPQSSFRDQGSGYDPMSCPLDARRDWAPKIK